MQVLQEDVHGVPEGVGHAHQVAQHCQQGDERAQGATLMAGALRSVELAVRHEDQPRCGVPLQQLQAKIPGVSWV